VLLVAGSGRRSSDVTIFDCRRETCVLPFLSDAQRIRSFEQSMTTIAGTGRITVKPGAYHGWIMMTQRSRWEMYFHTRQRALQFARAYAKLNPPATLEVVGDTGDVETKEVFEDTLRDASPARHCGQSPGS
jgi:hypothetical protein